MFPVEFTDEPEVLTEYRRMVNEAATERGEITIGPEYLWRDKCFSCVSQDMVHLSYPALRKD